MSSVSICIVLKNAHIKIMYVLCIMLMVDYDPNF